MTKYRTEFKVKVAKEYLKFIISYKYLSEKYCIPDKGLIIRWVNDFREKKHRRTKTQKERKTSKNAKANKDIKRYQKIFIIKLN